VCLVCCPQWDNPCAWFTVHSGRPGEERRVGREALLHEQRPDEDPAQEEQASWRQRQVATGSLGLHSEKKSEQSRRRRASNVGAGDEHRDVGSTSSAAGLHLNTSNVTACVFLAPVVCLNRSFAQERNNKSLPALPATTSL